ncbi:hypothetical protein UFOVP323_25 [uncultured Caudovirales phage]|uniref:Concanavalin A-like lectin/glucanases superfamily n=1 Tax=uncultured Caudovirales phage TaxID=2100421 RepID=A0A6J5LS77_9CAUD|nr:hypothetical protein UFOVP323_25 [uncultured Caudovirales phage]
MNPILSGLTWWVDFTNTSSLIIGGGSGVAILKATNLANTGLYFSGVPGNYTQSDSSGFVSSYATYNTSVSDVGFGLTNKLGDYGSYQEYTSWFMVNNSGPANNLAISSDNEQNYLSQQQGYRWFSVDSFPSGTDIRTYTFYSDNTSVSPEPAATGSTNTWYVGAVRTYQSGSNATTELWVDGVLVSATTQTKTLLTAVDPIFRLVSTNSTTQKITETFFYDRKLSDSEMSDNFAYFNQKYYGIGPVTPTPTATPTPTPTIPVSPTNTQTPSVTPTLTPTNTTTPSETPTNTPTPSITPSVSASAVPQVNINFKTIADDFLNMSNYHKQINSFGLGNIDGISYLTTSRDKQDNPHSQPPIFPLLFVVPSTVVNDLQYKTWEFNSVIMDIVQRDLSDQVDTLSDTLQMLQDIISQFRLSVTAAEGLYNNKYYLDEFVNCTPFMEDYADMTNGWNGLLKLKTMTPLNRCAAAYNTWTGSPIIHDTINIKTFHDDFRTLSEYHKQINSFGFGQQEDLSFWTEMRDKVENTHFNSPIFPLLYVIPNEVEQKFGFMQYNFTLIVMDIVERDLTNQIDVLSDTNQIMDDIISQFRLSVTNSLGNFNAKYTLQNPVVCIPFIEQYTDLTAGWSAQISVEVMNSLNRCDAAFNSWLTPSPTATPTNTPTVTNTPSVTQTQTSTPSETPTSTPTNTPSETPTSTPTPSVTQTNTPTVTNTPTTTTTLTSTPTPSVTQTNTPTNTNTPSVTPTNTPTPSITPSGGGSPHAIWNTNDKHWNSENDTWDTV